MGHFVEYTTASLLGLGSRSLRYLAAAAPVLNSLYLVYVNLRIFNVWFQESYLELIYFQILWTLFRYHIQDDVCQFWWLYLYRKCVI